MGVWWDIPSEIHSTADSREEKVPRGTTSIKVAIRLKKRAPAGKSQTVFASENQDVISFVIFIADRTYAHW
jgi:hypothetical protein